MGGLQFESKIHEADNLLAGKELNVLEHAEIDETVAVKRGTVLGRVTASKKLKICKSSASDGSQVPCAIMADNLEQGEANKHKFVYLAGKFREEALIYDESIKDKAQAKIELHKVSIFLV